MNTHVRGVAATSDTNAAKFKPGDRVRCFKVDPYGEFVGIKFVGHDKHNDAERFELAYKIGDKVVSTVTQMDVTKGSTYTVTGIEHDGVGITDNAGDDFLLYWSEFEPALTVEAGREPWLYASGAELVVTPKFKIGDRVRFNANYRHAYMRGKHGTIVSGDDSAFAVKLDERFSFGHTCGGITPEGYGRWADSDDLELINASDKPATLGNILAASIGKSFTCGIDMSASNVIVCAMDGKTPLPATRPYVHFSVATATKEADRLAGLHAGTEFGVYELVTKRKTDKLYDHEWQRLAKAGKKIDAIRELRRVAGLGLATSKTAIEDWLERI
jgi:hypothetical protein